MSEGVTCAIDIEVNGERRAIPSGQSLPALLVCLDLPPQAVLVELNGCPLLRGEWSTVALANGDRLEILRIVAGG